MLLLTVQEGKIDKGDILRVRHASCHEKFAHIYAAIDQRAEIACDKDFSTRMDNICVLQDQIFDLPRYGRMYPQGP